jgi:hypothetical protein
LEALTIICDGADINLMNQEISPWSFYETKLNKLGPKAITISQKGSNNGRVNKYLGSKTSSLRTYENST